MKSSEVFKIGYETLRYVQDIEEIIKPAYNRAVILGGKMEDETCFQDLYETVNSLATALSRVVDLTSAINRGAWEVMDNA